MNGYKIFKFFISLLYCWSGIWIQVFNFHFTVVGNDIGGRKYKTIFEIHGGKKYDFCNTIQTKRLTLDSSIHEFVYFGNFDIIWSLFCPIIEKLSLKHVGQPTEVYFK